MMATALMKPALVTIFLFQFVVIWNNFFLPLIMLVDRKLFPMTLGLYSCCLLYTSDAADERSSVDLGGRRIIKTTTLR